jgi:hypothetical protein
MSSPLLHRFLAGVLVLGLAGAGAELLLLGHTESWQQWVPLVLIAAGLAVLAWHGLSVGSASLLVLRGVMTLCVLGGLVGIGLHYQGNVEFATETYSSIGGFELFERAMTGATPALAPGALAQLGLLGLVYTFRHPRLASAVAAGDTSEG